MRYDCASASALQCATMQLVGQPTVALVIAIQPALALSRSGWSEFSQKSQFQLVWNTDRILNAARMVDLLTIIFLLSWITIFFFHG